MNEPQRINWRVIAVACAISFVVSVVLGVGCGIFGVVACFAAGEGFVDAVLSPLGYTVGFIASLIPVVVGAWYVVESVQHDAYKHCTLFGAINLVLGYAFGLLFEPLTFGWYDVLYGVAVVLTAVITARIAGR